MSGHITKTAVAADIKLSVVVPAFNEEKLLPSCLEAIRAAVEPLADAGWGIELIVCDNNSTDRTAEIARGAGARVVLEPVNQIARARNSGARVALGEWLVFVDADSRPDSALFSAMAEQIRNGRCLAGGCPVRFETSVFWAGLMVALWNQVSRRMKWAAGAFLFCEAAAFRAVGGFDERLYAAEEVDLSRRLKALARRTGRKMVILADHPLLTSSRKLHLYSPAEHLRFMAKVILRPGRTLRNRGECPTWYDGRR